MQEEKGDIVADLKIIKKEIEKLIDKGVELTDNLQCVSGKKECKNFANFLGQYEIWYTKALPVIKQLSSDRVQDFALLYSNPKRKEVEAGNYCICDALTDTRHYMDAYGPWTASFCVLRQVSMLQACADNLESIVSNIQGVLQADVFDSEIDSAKHLLKKGFYRAAGAICGVILEKHFAGVCTNHNIAITKKNPTIADYNDKLKDNVYDTIEWRRIQRLGDLRNLCDHNKDRDPTKDEVEELILGTERIIKTIF